LRSLWSNTHDLAAKYTESAKSIFLRSRDCGT
jgi:hypothetical protein